MSGDCNICGGGHAEGGCPKRVHRMGLPLEPLCKTHDGDTIIGMAAKREGVTCPACLELMAAQDKKGGDRVIRDCPDCGGPSLQFEILKHGMAKRCCESGHEWVSPPEPYTPEAPPHWPQGKILDPSDVNLEDGEHTVDAPPPSTSAQDRAAYEASIRDVYGLSEFVAKLQADLLEASWDRRKKEINSRRFSCADCGQEYPALEAMRGHWKTCPGEEAAQIRGIAEERDRLKDNAICLMDSLHIADLRTQDAEDRFAEERERKKGAVKTMLEASRRADKLGKELADTRRVLQKDLDQSHEAYNLLAASLVDEQAAHEQTKQDALLSQKIAEELREAAREVVSVDDLGERMTRRWTPQDPPQSVFQAMQTAAWIRLRAAMGESDEKRGEKTNG